MDQRDLKEGMDGRNALDNDVTALLSALPRVEAPGNFDFGVRGKIAAGRAKPRSGFLPFLKVAAPLGLLLLVTGLVFFYGVSTPTVVPPIAEDPTRTVMPSAPSPDIAVATVPAVGPAATEQPGLSNQIASKRAERPVREATSSLSKRDRGGSIDFPSGGGSVDRTLGQAKQILPPGFESANPRRTVDANTGSSTDVPLSSVFGMLGITVEFAGGAGKVSSVGENTLAARAGMKAGDVVETIDGRRVNSDTKLKGEGVKILGVRRDGRSLSLKIGN